MYDVFAAVVGDPGKGGDIWGVGNGFGYPSAGVDCCNSGWGEELALLLWKLGFGFVLGEVGLDDVVVTVLLMS